MILVIDNYDSFTHNLVHLVGEINQDVKVVRNDAITAAEAVNSKPLAILLSPGPCTPDDAGICLDLVTLAAKTSTPLFGVCLGMQSIAQAFGGKISRAGVLMHGKIGSITHDQAGIFSGLPSPFQSTRYHSLVVDKNGFPNCLEITATDEDGGEIMAIAHKTQPIVGVQFHPESIASEQGQMLLRNFFDTAIT